jgi:hypothetical protein
MDREGTYPLTLPKWGGGLLVDGYDDFSRIVSFKKVLASPLWGISYPKQSGVVDRREVK